MKFKFNKFEKAVGIFVGCALFIFVCSVIILGVKQRWFAKKFDYIAYYQEGAGLRPGTNVTCSGLNAGTIKEVSIDEDNRIKVIVSVYEEFIPKIKSDSIAKIVRPFLIGDKMIYITAGSKDKANLPPGTELQTEESMELTDLLSGGKLGPQMAKLSTYMNTLQALLDSFMSRQKNASVMKIYDELLPTLRSLQSMKNEIGMIRTDFVMTDNMQNLIKNASALTDANAQVLVKNLNAITDTTTQKLVRDLATLTTELNKTTPEIPKLNESLQNVLTELRVTLKALQKSWILKSNVQEVREEEKQGQKIK